MVLEVVRKKASLLVVIRSPVLRSWHCFTRTVFIMDNSHYLLFMYGLQDELHFQNLDTIFILFTFIQISRLCLLSTMTPPIVNLATYRNKY